MSSLKSSDSKRSVGSSVEGTTTSGKYVPLERGSSYSICADSSDTTLELSDSVPSMHNIKSKMKALPLFCVHNKDSDAKELSLHLIKLARKTGFLSLAGRGISTVPEKVYCLSELDDMELTTIDLSLDHDGDRWWDHVNLTRLDLSSNQLTTMSPKVSNLVALTRLDLHNNKITHLPKEVESLKLLTHLNLGHNDLSVVPEGIYSLTELRFLLMAHNRLSVISERIGDLVLLEMLDLSNNLLTGTLQPAIGFLTRLISMDVSHNQITEITADITSLRCVVDLDFSDNHIDIVPHFGMLRKLEIFNLRNNRIACIPQFAGAINLREIYLGGNLITNINPELLEGLSRIHVLELRDNKIESIPEDLEVLQGLRRLDMSNNHIVSLPTCLTVLPNLRILLLEGNPLHNVRKDIIARGPTGVLNYLRTLTDIRSINRSSSSYCRKLNQIDSNHHLQTPDRCTMRANMSLCYSGRKVEEIPDELFAEALMAEITTVDLERNVLKVLPPGLEKLSHFAEDISVAFNRITEIAPFMGGFTRLTKLNLSNNQLTDLPAELSALPMLKELQVAHNRLFRVPMVVYNIAPLEILSVHDNRISEIDVEGLSKLNRLANLDVSYNSIRVIPPELGKLQYIKSLNLIGNMFRTPRRSIMEQGTAAVLEYLRDRIPK